MSELLRDLPVLVLDCQAAGATPAYGDLLELGWAVCSPAGESEPTRSHWIIPRTERRVARAVRELTGWTESCVEAALPEHEAWAALHTDSANVRTAAGVPTVIHFARFELPFLRDLHARLAADEPFPFDTICLHAIATRLFPQLPRRNIRALAGYLGHSPELVRRSAGHVAASAFIWRALVPRLEQASISTWSELKLWLEQPATAARSKRRVYPLAPERRRALPDRPGVYRFVRSNGDVIYVGKATSLKKRVASHFAGGGRATERALEMLTQVGDIVVTETASVLEAALLETDEIKRIDPPYNVQLRSGERSAWFATRDLSEAAAAPDEAHVLGPLPSQRAVSAYAALIALLKGAEPSRRLLTNALAVPAAYLPEQTLFMEGWSAFVADHLSVCEQTAARTVERAARVLWLERGRTEPETSAEDAAPDLWDLARVRRRLERNLLQGGLLLRRARWLCLLADADVAYRERDMDRARLLVFAAGQLVESRALESVAAIATAATRRPKPLRERQASFDASSYDRLRVLSTELRRVQDEGGELAVRVFGHTFAGDRLARLTCAV